MPELAREFARHPSKRMLQSSELYEETKSRLAAHGRRVGNVTLDLGTCSRAKDKVSRI